MDDAAVLDACQYLFLTRAVQVVSKTRGGSLGDVVRDFESLSIDSVYWIVTLTSDGNADFLSRLLMLVEMLLSLYARRADDSEPEMK